MPKSVEKRLRREAEKKFPDDRKRQDRYIYGTMRKLRKEGDNERDK